MRSDRRERLRDGEKAGGPLTGQRVTKAGCGRDDNRVYYKKGRVTALRNCCQAAADTL